MPIWVQIIIMVVSMVLSYLLTPKPKSTTSSPEDLEKPTASASAPVQVVFGTLTLQNPNCLYYGEISQETKKVKA